jgi:hypothetical protein
MSCIQVRLILCLPIAAFCVASAALPRRFVVAAQLSPSPWKAICRLPRVPTAEALYKIFTTYFSVLLSLHGNTDLAGDVTVDGLP